MHVKSELPQYLNEVGVHHDALANNIREVSSKCTKLAYLSAGVPLSYCACEISSLISSLNLAM